ncbi:MAG: hypothetical protein ACLSHU_08100 [Oscillospiraceae bacterium]
MVGCSRWIARRAAASSALSGIPVTVIANGIDTTVFRPRRQEAADLHRALSIPRKKESSSLPLPPFPGKRGLISSWSWPGPAGAFPSGYSPPVVAAPAGPTISPCWAMSPGGSTWRSSIPPPTPWSCAAARTTSHGLPEAAACGTPVVGFSVGGVAETILPGLGTAVPPGDIPSMQRALLELPSPLPAAVERARVLWDCQRMAEDYLALYRAITRQEVL